MLDSCGMMYGWTRTSGPIGRFKRVKKTPERPLVDSKPHWGRCLDCAIMPRAHEGPSSSFCSRVCGPRATLFFCIGLALEVIAAFLGIMFGYAGLDDSVFSPFAWRLCFCSSSCMTSTPHLSCHGILRLMPCRVQPLLQPSRGAILKASQGVHRAVPLAKFGS